VCSSCFDSVRGIPFAPKNKLKKGLLFKMKSSIVFEVMRGKMKYEEYYKQASAAVSYCELGRDEFPQFDDIFVDCHKEGKTVDECVEIWDDCVNEYVQEKCL
jgi:hypothetical protein